MLQPDSFDEDSIQSSCRRVEPVWYVPFAIQKTGRRLHIHVNRKTTITDGREWTWYVLKIRYDGGQKQKLPKPTRRPFVFIVKTDLDWDKFQRALLGWLNPRGLTMCLSPICSIVAKKNHITHIQ